EVGAAPAGQRPTGLTVALRAAQPALTGDAFLAVLQRGKLGLVALCSGRASPRLPVQGHGNRAALVRTGAENDLAAHLVAAFERRFVGTRWRIMVPAQAEAAG